MKSIIIGAVAIIAIGILVLTVTGKQNTQTNNNQPVVVEKQVIPSTPPTTSTEQVINEEIKTVEMEAGSFYYKPNIITIKKGEKVKIVMKSVSMMHDFVIDELGVKMPIVKNGDTGTVEFTADKIGTFEYYCSVGQHRQLGQIGKLVVE